MPAFLARAPAAPRDYAACSGCSLCLLVCPMWRGSHDPRLTPEGLAKGLQSGATVRELAAPIVACSLCGACDPVCPERIDLSGLIMDLRLRSANSLPPNSPQPAVIVELSARLHQAAGAAPAAGVVSRSAPVLLPGPELRADPALLARVQALLGLAVFDDDGADIALALELGVEIPQQRLHGFLDSLRGHTIVAADGLLLRQLRRWLPGSQRMGLGPALSTRAAVRSNLVPSDLYVIEPRAFHGDYERMVGYYDRLQRETGCSLSLDLQRIAIPAASSGLAQKLGLAAGDDVQAKWMLQGRKPARIVVESLADRAAFERVCDLPVVHLAELGEDPQMMQKFRHAFG
ncbi:MAG: 4Fe-4S dicluster domain-containing protein [Rhodocyclales bacterium]|nr:4Fe-4S dicluster domain-containing protein [Rhodocyclales bacterium]